MPAKLPKKRRTRVTLTRTSEVLDVRMAAELLTVSPDTVYDLFKRGELPGRKVGRKWLTTRNAVLRWIESSSENNTLARAIERGDRHVITTALKSGKAQIAYTAVQSYPFTCKFFDRRQPSVSENSV